MKIRVISDLCQGHNNCIRAAPELFKLDTSGYASARSEILAPEHLELARLAAENCPECAIEISEATGT